MSDQPKVMPQYLAGFAAALCAFAAGAPLGWSSPTQEKIQSGDAYGFTVSEDDFSWVGSAVMLGATLSCVPTGMIINFTGRWLLMMLLIIPFSIGWALLIFAKSVIMLIVGRLILGIAAGAVCVCAPVYTTEIATKEIRGTLGSYFQLLLCCGVTYSYIVGAFADVFILNVSCAILPIIFVVAFVCMPETPVYLISKGKEEQAGKSMKFLRGAEYNSSAEMAEIKSADAKTKETEVSLGQAMTRPIVLKTLFLSMMLMIFQQLSGINAVIFYSTSIFTNANTGWSPQLSTILVGVAMTLFTVVSMFLVDKLGRVPLLMISSTMMGVSTFLLGLFFVLKDKDEGSVKSLNWLPVSSTILYIIFFSIGYGPLPWLLMAELFTPDVKGAVGSISGASNWGFAFIITRVYPLVKNAIGVGPTFMCFTIISFIATVFVFFLIPETKGKTSTEIQEALGAK